jgi:perosamine synthetase
VKDLLCPVDSTLLEVLDRLRKNGKRVVFMVDGEERLCGVVSDGDMRRLVLEGRPLSEKIAPHVKPDYVVARQDDDHARTLARLNPTIKTIPIVDGERRVVDYVQLDKDVHLPIAHPDLGGNEFNYLVTAFLSTWISSTGEYIERFERDFASFCECDEGVAVCNGTAALHLALVALGIGAGDEVIVPDLTFASPVNTVLLAGATPVLVDVEPDWWTIDPVEIRKAISPRTRAILPVHLYGQPCRMDAVLEIAREHGLRVVEDGAEAHGARYRGRRVGSFGDVGCFSFFANKVITTGEGGMCVTRSPELAARMRVLRDHGMSKERKYWHEEVGFNYRMTNLQAAIGCAQLERIEQTLADRQGLEDRYRRLLADCPAVEFQKVDPDREKITWLVSVLVRGGARDAVLARLSGQNIDVRPFFYSVSRMPPYRQYAFSGTASARIAEAGLNLPTQAAVGEPEILKIRQVLEEVTAEQAARKA